MMVHVVYNVITADSDKSSILKFTRNITKSNSNMLNQMITLQKAINNVANSNHAMLNKTASDLADDRALIIQANNISATNAKILNERTPIIRDLQNNVQKLLITQANNNT